MHLWSNTLTGMSIERLTVNERSSEFTYGRQQPFNFNWRVLFFLKTFMVLENTNAQ